MTDLIVSEKVDQKTIEDFLFSSDTKLTDQQKGLFIQLAIRCNLNPFKREIYAIPYGNKMSIVTGYEVYLKRAESSKMLDGWKSTIEKIGDDYRAIVTINRKDWHEPFIHEVFMSEYNTHQGLWNSKPMTMLKKVAIAQAFRLAFPNELGGMIYTADEMQDAQPIEHVQENTIKEVQPDYACISSGLSKYVHVFFKKAEITDENKNILLDHYFGVTDTGAIYKKDWIAFNHEIEKLLGRSLTRNDEAITDSEFTLVRDYLEQILATINERKEA